MNLKSVPKWAWVAAGVVAIGVWYYVHKQAQAGSTAATATGAGNDNGSGTGVDESQLASDVAGQLSAALGGTPSSVDSGAVQSPDDSAVINGLLQLISQSQQEFSDYATSMHSAGVGGGAGTAGGSTGGGTGSGVGTGSAGANNAPVITPTQPDAATSFFPAGTDVSGGGSPLYAFQGGTQFAASPVAGSVFSVTAPAAAGYEALGVHPSAPITFAPVPGITAPYAQTPTTHGPRVGA